MQQKTVSFNPADQPDFVKTLNKRVNEYFKSNKINKKGNLNMKLKTVFMVALYIVPLVLMHLGLIQSISGNYLMWVLMGLGMTGIGLSIMHDANHGAYSKNQRTNRWMGYLLNIIGGYHVNWKIQHNVLHHSFTNVEGLDEDIENGLLRFSPSQDLKWFHKFQFLYAPFLYSLMTIYWCLTKDFEQLVRYNKLGLYAGQGVPIEKAWRTVITTKFFYMAAVIVLPIIFWDIAWYHVILGFCLMQGISGLILALIFQPAHVVEHTDFFLPDDDQSIGNSWAVHQLKTTSNFANQSRIFSWFIGGLNFQIEHHLFPNICHVHYKNLAPIVKKTAREFNIPYYEHKTFASAVWSHFIVLYKLGMGTYKPSLVKS